MVREGTRLGPYEIQSAIGAGGMGEVYRAVDTNLGRPVAIKVLPDAFAQDPDRLARFEREAKTLATLNHPHIAQIYGFERLPAEVGSHGRALVMELVEGPTLADRIAQGPLPLEEALPIARQIAEALEAAHDQGIIHRDLKPANIKVRHDGTVKVLDFGLAKAYEPVAAMANVSMSPTVTSPAMTQAGVILGTAAYMSPEQARGKPADRRSDIWAFGCVLYEMLTGSRAFEGEGVSDTISAVLRAHPDWNALPVRISPVLATFLRRCLEKDTRERVGDVRDLRLALTGALDTPIAPGAVKGTTRWHVAMVAVAAVVTGAAVAGGAVWLVTRPATPRVTRTAITPIGAATMSIDTNERNLTITRDGANVVYVGDNGTQLFVRPLGELESMPIARGSLRGPIVSPNGQWVAFADNLQILKKVAMTGGAIITVLQMDAASRGATWIDDETIVFATLQPATGLQRVSASGGSVTVLTRPNRDAGEIDHLWPHALPGGRGVLFTITGGPGIGGQVAVLDLATGSYKVVLNGGQHAQYVASGHLIYVVGTTLRAVPFDIDRLETSGAAVPVLSPIVATPIGAADVALGADGTLVYTSVPGTPAPFARTLTWVDRSGVEQAIPAPPRAYVYPRISADGRSAVVYVGDEEADLWSLDLDRGTLTRLTFFAGNDQFPVLMPDGRSVVFSSQQSGAGNIFRQAADGTGIATQLTKGANLQFPTGVSPDGRDVIYYEVTPERRRDLLALELGSTPRERPLLQTPFDERNGVVSGDGRWLAYESDSTGRFEIYVRPYPNVADGQWQISNGGGVRPLWAPSGRELYYLTLDGSLMVVPIESSRGWSAGAPSKLLNPGYYFTAGGSPGRTYDISPDGRRFLMIKAASDALPQILVVQNFTEELKRLVPTN